MGGGQTGGDQYTDNTDAPRTQQKDSTYGGDQTDLNAGGDTNYGVQFSSSNMSAAYCTCAPVSYGHICPAADCAGCRC